MDGDAIEVLTSVLILYMQLYKTATGW